ncbi:MAG TPA: hypothetical protein VK841_02575 [Polyangiaceae bacterium]|jgi:hypothetical protein|nr:hypothetical protein [Polyangiaceae bacterium]
MRGSAPVLGFFATAILVGITWGLPSSDTWAADSISPRSCGLGAIAQTYWPGHFHTYPPLHMAILTVLSLPWMGLAAARAGTGAGALAAELIKPLYMTGIEASARAVAAAMALGIVVQTIRLWTRLWNPRVGVVAGAVVALNSTLVYYAHTGNLEVPYLFWLTWALVEMDRVMAGEPRERPALLLAAAAVLTKDQAAAALLLPLPLALLVVPWVLRRASPARRSLVTAAAIAAVAYALVSGAVTNPVGFARRIAFLLGPASQTWAGYPHTAPGALSLARDALLATPHFSSWPVALAAIAGLILAAKAAPAPFRLRRLVPFAAAVSFAVFFTLGARRSEDRFLLPESLGFFPYAAVAFGAAWDRWASPRLVFVGMAAAAFTPALLAVASVDATLLADSRYDAERFLQRMQKGAHVVVYGGPIFLPRIPSSLVAERLGIEPIADRQAIAGITDVVDPAMNPRSRSPAAIVLSTELSTPAVIEPPSASKPFGLMQYADAKSHGLFRSLFDGSLGYVRVLRAECTLPDPLECRNIHDSTGREVWIYMRDVRLIPR